MFSSLLRAAHLYCTEHIIFIVLFFVASAVSITLIKIKVKNPRTLDLTVKILGGVLLALIIFNRIAIAFHRETGWGLIPDSFCGTGSLGLSITCIFFKRGSHPYHMFVYLMLFGGTITIFYPDFLGQLFHEEATSFWYPATISGLLHHALAAYISVLLIVTGHFTPSVKKTFVLPIGLCFMLVYGQFIIDTGMVDHAMYIGRPLIAGTFITWYVVDAALVAFGYGYAYIYEYIMRKKSALPSAEANAETQEETPEEANAESENNITE